MMYEWGIEDVLDPPSSWFIFSTLIMPPRGVIAGIIIFWMGMTGWLLFRELWPQLQPGQPPPFRIDLADEAQNNIPIRWSIFKGEPNPCGYIRTWVNFRDQDDTFELVGQFKLWTTTNTEGQPDFVVLSKYRVTREGELRDFESSIELKIPKGFSKPQEGENAFHVEVLRLS